MKIALLGYGKMGQAIEAEAVARGHEITHRLNKGDDYASLLTNRPEVIIAFTHPDAFVTDLDFCLKNKLPLVCGTTGWYAKMDEVKEQVAAAQGVFLFSANFSIGVNVLFKLNQRLAELMNGHPQYDCYIEEGHHRHKADGPSGTAIALAQGVLDKLDRKTAFTTDLTRRPPTDEELSIGFVRAGEIIGEHAVTYTSDIDTLRIEHRAHNRRGFALGAVVAAEKLPSGPGFYQFADLL